MDNLNKYGIVSGGYIFDYLDKESHNIAVNNIGECVTASGYIQFFRPLVMDLQECDMCFEILAKTTKTITIISNIIIDGEIYVSANFMFVKTSI